MEAKTRTILLAVVPVLGPPTICQSQHSGGSGRQPPSLAGEPSVAGVSLVKADLEKALSELAGGQYELKREGDPREPLTIRAVKN